MSKSTKEAANGLRMLPKTFSPSINEVIIGRGRKVVNHCGNQRFQDLIHAHLHEYSKAKSKASKSAIIMRVLTTVKQGSPEDVGGFVKPDAKTKRWYAMEDSSARISTAQAFRDALSGSYRSSKQYKQQRRWNMKGPFTPTSSTSSGSSVSSGAGSATASAETSTPSEITMETDIVSPAVLDQDHAEMVAASAPSAPLKLAHEATQRRSYEGLRDILDSALGLMDDDLFLEDLDVEPETTPDRTASVEVASEPKVDALGALLERFDSHEVEWTENPFEPTPLMLLNKQEGDEDHMNLFPAPKVAHSNGEDFYLSLRGALSLQQ